jgi:hypothetical protein
MAAEGLKLAKEPGPPLFGQAGRLVFPLSWGCLTKPKQDVGPMENPNL